MFTSAVAAGLLAVAAAACSIDDGFDTVFVPAPPGLGIPRGSRATTWDASAASSIPNSSLFFVAVNRDLFLWNPELPADTRPELIAAGNNISGWTPPADDPWAVQVPAWSRPIMRVLALDAATVFVLVDYRLYRIQIGAPSHTVTDVTPSGYDSLANTALRATHRTDAALMVPQLVFRLVAGRNPLGHFGTCVVDYNVDSGATTLLAGVCGSAWPSNTAHPAVNSSIQRLDPIPYIIDSMSVNLISESTGTVDVLVSSEEALLYVQADILTVVYKRQFEPGAGPTPAVVTSLGAEVLAVHDDDACTSRWVAQGYVERTHAATNAATFGANCTSGSCVCRDSGVRVLAVKVKEDETPRGSEYYVLAELTTSSTTGGASKSLVRYEAKDCHPGYTPPTAPPAPTAAPSSDSSDSTTVIIVAVVVPVGVLIVVIVVVAVLLLRSRGSARQTATDDMAPGSQDGDEMKQTVPTKATSSATFPAKNGNNNDSTTMKSSVISISGVDTSKISDDDASDIADSDDDDDPHANSPDAAALAHVPAASMANFESESIDDEQRFLLKLFAPTLEERRRFKLCRRRVEKRRYTKGRLLGRGANGSVYSVLLKDGSTIAMKEINLMGSDAEVAEQVDAVMAEMRMLARLAHPNLIKYYGVTPDRENLQVRLFMENISGGSLASLVQSMDAALDERLAQRYTVQIVRGLAVIHESGIVHRDMKCDNVLIDSATGCVKLADFGTAKSVAGRGGGATAQMAQTMIGTPYFMAPEIIMASTVDEAEAGYGRKADIWSLGILVAEMLSQGNPPWPPFPTPAHAFMHIANPASQPVLPEGLSAGAADFIRQCTRREPRERPAAVELLRHEWLSGMQQYNPGRNDPLSRTS